MGLPRVGLLYHGVLWEMGETKSGPLSHHCQQYLAPWQEGFPWGMAEPPLPSGGMSPGCAKRDPDAGIGLGLCPRVSVLKDLGRTGFNGHP